MNKGNTDVSFRDRDSYEREIDEVLKYLKADKRIYLYESVRNVLTLLNGKIEIYEKISKCSITTGLNLYQSIKEGLLIGKDIIWLGQVYHIEFNRDDYNLIDTEMSYGSEDIYYDVWLEIE